MKRILAMCDRPKNGHALARIGVRDGRAVIEYLAGAHRHSEDVAGKASLKRGSWHFIDLDSEDAQISGAELYCSVCRRPTRSVRFADLVAVYRTNANPIVLERL